MTLTSNHSVDKLTTKICITGSFDFKQHLHFKNSYRDINDLGMVFKVNLAKVTYIDSSALAMLLLLKEHADTLSGKVVICQPSGPVAKTLCIASFDTFMAIES